MLKRKSVAAIAAICTVVMSMSTMYSIGASAEVTAPKTAATEASAASAKENDAEMAAALAAVKGKIKIPDSYSEFRYSVSKNRGVNSYEFRWQHPSIDDGGYSVTAAGDVITRYVTPNAYYSGGKVSIGPFTADDYEKKALDWIYGVNPSMKGQLRRKGSVSMSIGSDSVSINFERVNGGTAVRHSNNTVTAVLDKKTGSVKRMQANGWWQGAEFENPAKAMSADKIFGIYSDEITVKPWYRISYSGDKKIARIVYEPTESSPEYNAVTGGRSSREEDMKKLSNTDLYEDVVEDAEEDADAGNGGVMVTEAAKPTADFSEQEKEALKEVKGMLTAEKFKKLMIADPYINVTDSYLTDSFRIFESERAESGYMISCTFNINNKKEYCTYDITADAKSGKVYRFYRDGGKESDEIISPAKAAKLGTQAAKYYYGDIFDSYKADTENSAPASRSSDGKYKETVRTLRFYRYVNNIQVDGNVINVTVNSAGEVLEIYANHTTGVDFGDGRIISRETAMEKLFEQVQPELSYRGFTDLKSEPHTYLTYQMPDWRINAKTGQLCDYTGAAVTKKTEAAEICPYKDIGSSPYKSEIETLYNYGVRIFPGENFNPKANITNKETEDILRAMLGYGIAVYYAEDEIDTEDIIEAPYDDMGNPNIPAGAVTNRQFAKKFVTMMNGEEYAKMSGIYKSPFGDIAANDPDLGYICIAYGYGAACGENGKFNPDAPVTREFAMHCVYNFIKKQST